MGVPRIIKGAQDSPVRAGLIGGPGTGKTTLASLFPKPIIGQTEDGAFALNVDKFDLIKTWQELIESVEWLETEEHDYKTFVVDTIGDAEKMLHDYVCKKYYKGKWDAERNTDSFMNFGRGYKTSAQEIDQLTERLDRLRAKRGMNIILIAHAQNSIEKNPLGSDWGKITGNLHKEAWQKILGWCDIVGYIGTEKRVIGGDGDRAGKAVAKGGRTITFDGHPGLDVKTRAGFDLPAVMPLDYEELAAHLFGNKKPHLEELKAEFEALLGNVDAETAEKAVAYIGKKPTVEKLKAAINRLILNLQAESEKANATV